jgi:hypothetical protein
MDDGITPNLSLIKPDVGASDDTWGDKLNHNFDILDGAVQTVPVPLPANNPPLVAGAANPGVSLLYSRGDHVHPNDSSKVDVATIGETIDDRVAALLIAGTNITLTYNDPANTLKIDAAGGGGGGASVTISDNPPGSPTAGNLWWESDSGNLYIYYNDGNSSQWVLVTPQTNAASFGAVTYTPQTPSAAQQVQAQQNIGLPTVMRSYLAGLTLSTPGTSANFTVQPGVAADSTNAAMMILAAAITKTTAAWAVGTAVGALDTGAIAASTWYHAYLIRRPDTGVVDVLVSLNATAPTLPANYTQFRRIGSMKTNASSQWTNFNQNGDEFLWTTGVQDVNGVAVALALILTSALSVPTGLKVGALMRVGTIHSTATTALLLCSPDEVPTLPIGVNITVQTFSAAGSSFAAIAPVRTNTSAQVAVVSQTATGTTYFIYTYGWIDRRGRDA